MEPRHHKPNPKTTKDPCLPESYRPISLTSAICKIMEKMVTNRLQWFTEKKKILTKDQTGFTKTKSMMLGYKIASLKS